MSESQRTELEEFGEFGLIDHLTSSFYINQKETKQGIGDDAAVCDPHGKQVILTTDMLVENVHFDLMYSPLKHLGYKSVVVNVSDVFAMNGVPKHILVSIGMSNRFSVEALEELYSGIQKACDHYGVDLIGGDTCSTPRGLTLSITAVGYQKADKIVRRRGAKPGDLLCVSGDLGAAYLGLQLLEREKRIYMEHPSMQPDLTKHEYAVGRQLKPEARADVIKTFEDLDILPTSMIDISDGLASEVIHLSKNSEVSFLIHEDKLPIEEGLGALAMEIGLETTMAALHGGEDYELLFTMPQSEYDKIKDHPDISIIGYAREEPMGNQMVSKGGQVVDLIAQGWNHFNNQSHE
jgi:thiamine-monophosphate kinase